MIFRIVFFFKQKTAYEMRISDWSSDVCSSDLASGECHWIDAVLPICDSAHEGGRGRLYCQHRIGLGLAGRRVARGLWHVKGGGHLADPLYCHSAWQGSHSLQRPRAGTNSNAPYTGENGRGAGREKVVK